MLTQDSDLYMTSLNLDSLFTNIPLDETIGICLNKLFQNPKTSVNRISKNDFCDLLNLATKEPAITFKNKFYIQVEDVAMESLQVRYQLPLSVRTLKKTGLINFLKNLNQRFIEGIWIIFLYSLYHLNLSTSS